MSASSLSLFVRRFNANVALPSPAHHLAGLRDATSGVSLQEEMSNLSQFQHASEAQVKFLSAVDELLGSIIEGL